MNVFKLPSRDNPVATQRAPAYSPRINVPRHEPFQNRHSPSPQKFENINNALINTSAAIDVKYVQSTTNKVSFVKITNEFGQQLVALINFDLSNVEPSISDVSIREKSQMSYPEHLSEFIKTAGQQGFGLANETRDGMTIVMNTDVTHYQFATVREDTGFHRDKQYIVANIDSIVGNLQSVNRQIYTAIHSVTNITQRQLFDNMNQYVMNVDIMRNRLLGILETSDSVLRSEINCIGHISREKVEAGSTGIYSMQYKMRLRNHYDTINRILDLIAELDHHMSVETLFSNVEKCSANVEMTCNHA